MIVYQAVPGVEEGGEGEEEPGGDGEGVHLEVGGEALPDHLLVILDHYLMKMDS